MWGIVPAAGAGTRIQPLAFSKELLAVSTRADGDMERPRAVSEYLIERMLIGGVKKICFVISPRKYDILEYYGGKIGLADICYVIQPQPTGLCDAIFRALPLISPEEQVLVGLPDTIWYPEDGYRALGADELSFLLFPVDRPEFFDSVVADDYGRVIKIYVKQSNPDSSWVWGAFKLTGAILRELYELWCERERCDEYVGTLTNAYIAKGGKVSAVRAGEAYVDVGTVPGYREAINLLSVWEEKRREGSSQ